MRKQNPYNKDKDQIKTYPTTTEEIMESDEFALGVIHVRTGKALDWKIGSRYGGEAGKASHAGRAWDYERGRMFGRLAPRTMPLRINGRLNPDAVDFFDACYRQGDWL
jgi:hypothetical protein